MTPVVSSGQTSPDHRETTRLKVLYLLGSSRTGSTLLDNILGEFDGFFSAGEVRFLWRRLLENRRCGCGQPIGGCEVWDPSSGRSWARIATDSKLNESRSCSVRACEPTIRQNCCGRTRRAT